VHEHGTPEKEGGAQSTEIVPVGFLCHGGGVEQRERGYRAQKQQPDPIGKSLGLDFVLGERLVHRRCDGFGHLEPPVHPWTRMRVPRILSEYLYVELRREARAGIGRKIPLPAPLD
jgi:hypothetical protein